MEWQPISTAPKDGTHIFLYEPYDHPCVAFYVTSPEWSGWMFADELLADVKPEGPEPTHWMPLPPPPKG